MVTADLGRGRGLGARRPPSERSRRTQAHSQAAAKAPPLPAPQALPLPAAANPLLLPAAMAGRCLGAPPRSRSPGRAPAARPHQLYRPPHQPHQLYRRYRWHRRSARRAAHARSRALLAPGTKGRRPGLQLPAPKVAASSTLGRSLQQKRCQSRTPRVAATSTKGRSLQHLGLQPRAHGVCRRLRLAQLDRSAPEPDRRAQRDITSAVSRQCLGYVALLTA